MYELVVKVCGGDTPHEDALPHCAPENNLLCFILLSSGTCLSHSRGTCLNRGLDRGLDQSGRRCVLLKSHSGDHSGREVRHRVSRNEVRGKVKQVVEDAVARRRGAEVRET